MSSKIQPAVPKKSKKSSKQDELIYKNKIKEDGQDERLKEKAAQYRLFENNDTLSDGLETQIYLYRLVRRYRGLPHRDAELGRGIRVFERVGRKSQTDVRSQFRRSAVWRYYFGRNQTIHSEAI